jgi:hypothetical protein
MKQTNLYLITGAVLFLCFTYYYHTKNVEAAKLEIIKQEESSKVNFNKEKLAVFKNFGEKNSNYAGLMDSLFSDQKAILLRDTVVSTLFYKATLQINDYHPDYLTCLLIRSENEIKNHITAEEVQKSINLLTKRYGNLCTEWYNEIGYSKFILVSDSSTCKDHFPDNLFRTPNKEAFNEFQQFLTEYVRNMRKVEKNTFNNKQSYSYDLIQAKAKLNNEGKTLLQNKLFANNPMFEKDSEYTFNGKFLGQINYSFPSNLYSKEKLNSALEEAFKEQFRNNSLYNGATPYAYCYGSDNKCSGYGCSRIDVKAGGGDIVVTIKNFKDKVVRHGYVKSESTYSFNVSNGTYQVFFYAGSGWSPYQKIIESSTCGYLKGGFVNHGGVTKDSKVSLSNNILSYELTLQTNGNFNAQSSNLKEAF